MTLAYLLRRNEDEGRAPSSGGLPDFGGDQLGERGGALHADPAGGPAARVLRVILAWRPTSPNMTSS